MTRLIVIVVLVVAAIWLLRRAIAGPRRAENPGTTPQGELVACAHCRVNLPKSEARGVEGRFFCSEEHARLGARDG